MKDYGIFVLQAPGNRFYGVKGTAGFMIGLIIIEEYGLSVVADGQTEGESDLGFVIVGSVLFFQPLRFFIGEPFRFAAAFRIVRAVIVYGKSIFASGAAFLFAAGARL